MQKPYEIEFVRIEHNVYRMTVLADSEEDARKVAMHEIDWDDYDTVHAEEYFQTVECCEEVQNND